MQKAFGALRGLFVVCFAIAMAGILLQDGACIAVAALLLCGAVCIKCRLPHFTLWLFVGALLLRVAAVFLVNPPIISDFLTMYQAARQLNAGNLSYLQQSYFLTWAYQNAFVLLQAFLLRIVNDPMFLRLVGCLLSSGTVCLLYRMAKDWMHPHAARIAGVLAAAAPFSVLLPTLLTNQISSAFFLVLGVWLLAGKDCTRLRFWRYPLAGLALQIGNMLRPEGLIVLVGVFAWAVFSVLEHRDAWKRLLCGLLAMLVVYFAAAGAVDAGLRASGLSPNGLKNGNPLWKFVVGLNVETNGTYSPADQAHLAPTMTDAGITEQTIITEKNMIRERLSVPPGVLLRLFVSKIRVQWCDSSMHWFFGPFDDHPENALHETLIAALCTRFERTWFFLAVGLALFGLVCGVRRADHLLPYFIVFAAFCAFLLVETQGRYAYLPQLFVFLSAGFGVDRLLQGKEKKNA